MEEVKRNTVLVYTGKRGKSHDYLIHSSDCEAAGVGRIISFSKRIINQMVGHGVLCNTEDGQTWGAFMWTKIELTNKLKDIYGSNYSKWSADDRLTMEQEKLEKASKKKMDGDIGESVKDIKEGIKHMTLRQKMVVINWVTNELLK